MAGFGNIGAATDGMALKKQLSLKIISQKIWENFCAKRQKIWNTILIMGADDNWALASNKAVFTSNFGNNFLSENIFKQLSVQLFDKICGPMQNFIQRSLSSLLMGARWPPSQSWVSHFLSCPLFEKMLLVQFFPYFFLT